MVHLLFDPLLEAAAAMGAGLDWKTSLQELCAAHDLGVPEYVIEDEGPDHMKTFTAQVRVADRLHGHGVGRSKKEAEQQAAESAYRTLSAELPAGDAARTRERRRRRRGGRPPACRCLSCPRSRSSAAASSATSLGRPIRSRRGAAPAPGTPPPAPAPRTSPPG